MGRPTRHSGARDIRDAERLFLLSVANGKADFTYVALAIGSTPQAPPTWAVLACIELRQQHERRPARGNAADIEYILDNIVRFYDYSQRAYEALNHDKRNALDNYSPPPLRSAILHALKAGSARSEHYDNANGDWHRDIREAWKWEQRNDLDPTSLITLEEGDIVDSKRRLRTTYRINRVMMQTVATELGDPVDVDKWAYITRLLIEHESIK